MKAGFIAVAGSIGAGKSSLIRFLEARFGLHPFYERNEDNPFLADFYRDMRAYAFPAQVWFLARKFRAHQEIRHLDRPAVLDRTVYEDAEVFAENLHRRGFLAGRDYEAYRRLYDTIATSINPPDLLVYLKSGLRTIKKRIRLRGRAYEEAVDSQYLKDLNRLYERWLGSYRLSPVLELNADRLDFMSDLVDRIEVLETIEGHL